MADLWHVSIRNYRWSEAGSEHTVSFWASLRIANSFWAERKTPFPYVTDVTLVITVFTVNTVTTVTSVNNVTTVSSTSTLEFITVHRLM